MLKKNIAFIFVYGNKPFAGNKEKPNSKITTENFRVEDKAKGIYWAIYLELTSQIRKKKHYKQIL